MNRNHLINIDIGGVPEHFNLPWLRLLEAGTPRADGVVAHWQDYAGGSGAMISALNDQTLDIAVLLTEAAVAGIGRGGEFRIVSLYTRSPLVWGVHVPAKSRFNFAAELRGARYAISRLGSGSHLMAYAYVRAQGWPTEALTFVTVGSLNGAVDAFANDQADVFLWEKFMTKPVVDAGRFRRVAEFVAPWPAFVVCASQRALRDKRDGVAALLARVFPVAAAIHADPRAAAQIAERYGLLPADAAEWLAATQWASEPGVDPAVIDTVAATLAELGLIDARSQNTFTAHASL
jgi:ABC-type nitrate/sulfonate/bicarbonate transport system substrate-binding protein